MSRPLRVNPSPPSPRRSPCVPPSSSPSSSPSAPAATRTATTLEPATGAPRTADGGADGGTGDGGADGGTGDGGTGSTARTGLEGFCDYYVECGGTYYADAQACIDATLGYWDECRQAELDAFGDCMMAKVECEDWNPDAYNPASTPCADEWADVTGKDC